MIVAENLSKKFGNFTAINNLSFSLKLGETTAFLGPNGAGKSTTMRILAGYLGMDYGNVSVNGVSVRENPRGVKELIGYLPENTPLYKELTVGEFLKFCSELRYNKKSDRKLAIERVVELCGLSSVFYNTIDFLSKGYAKRVCLAQSILHDPEYLILDEPTDGLDPLQKDGIYSLLKNMSKLKAILISTHVLDEVECCCSRVILISRGKILLNDSIDSTKKRFSTLRNMFTEVAGVKRNT